MKLCGVLNLCRVMFVLHLAHHLWVSDTHVYDDVSLAYRYTRCWLGLVTMYTRDTHHF